MVGFEFGTRGRGMRAWVVIIFKTVVPLASRTSFGRRFRGVDGGEDSSPFLGWLRHAE